MVEEVAAKIAAEIVEEDVAVMVATSKVAHLVTHPQLASHTRPWQLQTRQKSNVPQTKQLQNRQVHPRS